MIPTLTGPNHWSAVAMLAVLGPCIAVDLWPELSHCTVSKKSVFATISTQPHAIIVNLFFGHYNKSPHK